MDQPTNVVPLRRPEVARRRISVATIVALSFGALVLVSIGSVLALTVGANYRNTFDLIGKRANLLIGAMEELVARAYEPGGGCRHRDRQAL